MAKLGEKRGEIEIAKMRLSLLRRGWKQMMSRHQEEWIKQHNKILEAQEALEKLEQENESE